MSSRRYDDSRNWYAIHTYSGYIMMVGLLFHIVWHWKWVKAVAKKEIGQ